MIFKIIVRLKSKLQNHNKIPSLVKFGKSNDEIKLFHSSAFSFGNAGDFLLPIILRDLFMVSTNVNSWQGNHVHQEVNNTTIERVNKTNGIVVGGGGLFLADTNSNSLSGWQWSCSLEQLEKIDVPLIIFAVGYNRFRDQNEFTDIFKKHIVKTVEKASFIGLRNQGSINNVKKYLPTNLHSKLEFQPCMTTVISKIYPNLVDYSSKKNIIAVNCAFDRSTLRFGNRKDEIQISIAKVIKDLSNDYEIHYYSHMENDLQITRNFNDIGLNYKIVNLQFKNAREIINHYSIPKLVIGMRGHAQLIPFGCETPILSIISHNKMKWFLDDIGQNKWGVDVMSVSFEQELLEKAKSILKDFNKTVLELKKAQDSLWAVTKKNMAKIKKCVN